MKKFHSQKTRLRAYALRYYCRRGFLLHPATRRRGLPMEVRRRGRPSGRMEEGVLNFPMMEIAPTAEPHRRGIMDTTTIPARSSVVWRAAGVLAAIFAHPHASLAQNIARHGPQFPEAFDMCAFMIRGFVKGDWPMVVDYEVRRAYRPHCGSHCRQNQARSISVRWKQTGAAAYRTNTAAAVRQQAPTRSDHHSSRHECRWRGEAGAVMAGCDWIGSYRTKRGRGCPCPLKVAARADHVCADTGLQLCQLLRARKHVG